MLQASVCDGGALDALSFGEDCLSSPEVDISRSEVVDALVTASIIVVLYEGVDLPFEITGQIVIVGQNAVLQGLVQTFYLSLSLGMMRRPAHMLR